MLNLKQLIYVMTVFILAIAVHTFTSSTQAINDDLVSMVTAIKANSVYIFYMHVMNTLINYVMFLSYYESMPLTATHFK